MIPVIQIPIIFDTKLDGNTLITWREDSEKLRDLVFLHKLIVLDEVFRDRSIVSEEKAEVGARRGEKLIKLGKCIFKDI